MSGSKARAARKERGKQYLIERLARAVQLNKRAKFTAAKREFIAKEKAEIEAELKKDREAKRAAQASRDSDFRNRAGRFL